MAKRQVGKKGSRIVPTPEGVGEVGELSRPRGTLPPSRAFAVPWIDLWPWYTFTSPSLT